METTNENKCGRFFHRVNHERSFDLYWCEPGETEDDSIMTGFMCTLLYGDKETADNIVSLMNASMESVELLAQMTGREIKPSTPHIDAFAQSYSKQAQQNLGGVTKEMYAEQSKHPHPYQKTDPYKGCAKCGYGPGAIFHNTHEVKQTFEKCMTEGCPNSATHRVEHPANGQALYCDECYLENENG